MADDVRAFYDDWGERQLADPRRSQILRWKASALATLLARSLPEGAIRSICEVGGGEGIVLDALGSLLGATRLVAYDVSATLCREGERRFPQIEFINRQLDAEGEIFDLVVLSDIIEHVDDPDTLVAAATRCGRHVGVKLPLERSLWHSRLAYRLRGSRKPDRLRFGPGHVNRHLHGYTVWQARRLLERHVELLDAAVTDTTFFYGTDRMRTVRRAMGPWLTAVLFGGALFALGRRR